MKFEIFGRSFSFLADSNQQQKALQVFEKYVFKPEVILLFIILLTYFIMLLVAKIRKNYKLSNTLKKLSPWIYLIVILWITVLNRTPGDREIRVAFDNWFTPTGFHETNVLGFMFNLAMYVPFGYLLCKYKKTTVAFICVILSSFIIEALQYILARGVTAVDDLTANIIGGIIGIFIAIILKKLQKQKAE